jgi:hypothetical protein
MYAKDEVICVSLASQIRHEQQGDWRQTLRQHLTASLDRVVACGYPLHRSPSDTFTHDDLGLFAAFERMRSRIKSIPAEGCTKFRLQDPAVDAELVDLGVDDASLAKLSTEDQLIKISTVFLRLISAQKFDSQVFRRFLSSNFRVSTEHIRTDSSVDEYFKTLKKMTMGQRTYTIEVMNSCADIEPAIGHAVVWATVRGTGIPYNELGQESVSRIQWTYKGGNMGWLCAGHVSLRGPGGWTLLDLVDEK